MPTETKNLKPKGQFEESLSCALTQAELLDRGAKLAQTDSDIRDHLAHADSVKKELKAKETALEAERSRLANIVRTKHEPRPTAVERWHDYQRRVAFSVRLDTGEVVPGSERPLFDDELQEQLQLGEKKQPVITGETPLRAPKLPARKLDESHLVQHGDIE